jgi:hypothetical protein
MKIKPTSPFPSSYLYGMIITFKICNVLVCHHGIMVIMDMLSHLWSWVQISLKSSLFSINIFFKVSMLFYILITQYMYILVKFSKSKWNYHCIVWHFPKSNNHKYTHCLKFSTWKIAYLFLPFKCGSYKRVNTTQAGPQNKMCHSNDLQNKHACLTGDFTARVLNIEDFLAKFNCLYISYSSLFV